MMEVQSRLGSIRGASMESETELDYLHTSWANEWSVGRFMWFTDLCFYTLYRNDSFQKWLLKPTVPMLHSCSFCWEMGLEMLQGHCSVITFIFMTLMCLLLFRLLLPGPQALGLFASLPLALAAGNYIIAYYTLYIPAVFALQDCAACNMQWYSSPRLLSKYSSVPPDRCKQLNLISKRPMAFSTVPLVLLWLQQLEKALVLAAMEVRSSSCPPGSFAPGSAGC